MKITAIGINIIVIIGLALTPGTAQEKKPEAPVVVGTPPASTPAPLLSDKDKYAIRDAQFTLSSLQNEKSAIELRLKELEGLISQAQQKLGLAAQNVTPAGYLLQNDLTLKPDPNGKPGVPKP